jgi:UDP-GlcNAc:undecaprenyl-phosphate GlcNAc-1-phosphate transferase
MLLIFIVSFLLTLGLIKVLCPLAVKIDLLDRPCSRKRHEGAIPLVGGIAIFINFIICIFALDLFTIDFLPFLLGLLIIITLGFIDDYFGLSFNTRFAFQLLAIIILIIFSGVELNSVGNVLAIGNIQLNWFVIPFTVFAVIGNINAFNMMDGIDGLTASLALVALVGFYIAAESKVTGDIYSILLLIIASLCAFLLMNLFAKNKVFMGDAGSMLIGFVISYFAIQFSQESSGLKVISPIACLWVLAIPVMDTVCIMIRRINKGQSPFLPDREHLHHIFLRAGYSEKQALVIIVIIASLLATIGLVANTYQVPEWIMFVSYLFVFLGYYQLLQHSWVLMRWLKVIHKPRTVRE